MAPVSLLERLHSHTHAQPRPAARTADTAAGLLPAPRRARLWTHQRKQARPQSTPNGASASTAPKDLPRVTIGCAPCMEGTQEVPIDESQVLTKFIAETLLPTRHGKFRVRGYKHSIDGGLTFTEPTAIISGKVEGQENVPVRVHDACFTSEVLGSLKCDCAEQLAIALEKIHKDNFGIVIYLQQEGRGIGLANKIAAYSLQERGYDTVDANRALGLPDDCREYTSVRNILKDLGIKSIQLITNNPRKISEMKALGLDITGRIPCLAGKALNEFNVGYLETKRDRMDHLLEGQFCFWNHDGEPRPPTSSTAGNSLDEPVVPPAPATPAEGNGKVVTDAPAAA